MTESKGEIGMEYVVLQVGVVGGGTMGGGIAALIARQGVPVVVKEENKELVEKARENIYERFQKWHDLNKIDSTKLEQLRSFVTVTASNEDLASVDLVIEAVPENLEMKKAIFQDLDALLPHGVILASNTSSLPITQLAAVTSRPDRVIGTHFFNPPTKMALVELVPGSETSEETLSIIDDFMRSTLQKITIRAADRPGFLVNCLLVPYVNEAVLGLETTTVQPEDLDAVARAFGWPMGPCTLLDTVGLDVAYFVAQFLAGVYGDRMPMGTLFETLYGMNRLGDKTGAGFYVTSGDHEPIGSILDRSYPNRNAGVSAEEIFERMMAGILNEASRALQDRVASKEDIELGAAVGIGCPGGGPLHLIDQRGVGNFVTQLERLASEHGQRFSPTDLLVQMAKDGQQFFSAW